jgi:hypothetical protein
MKSFHRGLFAAALILVAFACQMPARALGTSDWLGSFSDAQRLAAPGGKCIVMLFSGTGWDPASGNLYGALMDSPNFSQVASLAILLQVDLPQHAGKLTTDQAIQNNNLAVRYRVNVLPTLVVCRADGTKVLTLDDFNCSPEEVITKLLQAIDTPK